MDLGISNEWCTHYKTLSKIVKIEPIKDWVVHFSQNRVVHLHHSGAPKSITVNKKSTFHQLWSLETHFEFFANTISGAVQPIQLTLQPKKVGEQNRYVDSLLEAQKVGAQMRTLRKCAPCALGSTAPAFQIFQGCSSHVSKIYKGWYL